MLALVVLDAQLAGESQVGALETDEPGGRPFGPVERSMNLSVARSECRVKVTT
jgi:hypothetical protein